MTAITLDLRQLIHITDEQFYKLCQANPDIKLERNAKGELIVMPPTGGESGKRNADLTADLVVWNRQRKLGVVFDSSTGFSLPNGAKRSPDASWLSLERWNALTAQQRKRFLPLCPDFVIELMSETDALEDAQEKMIEYISNGLRLGWLLDPKNKRVEVYRQGQPVEVLQSPTTLSGEDVLPGFVLELSQILA